jgi:hypothetical protein
MIDVFHNATAIIMFVILVYSFGFSLPGTACGTVMWILLDPFFVYLIVFGLSEYADGKARLSSRFEAISKLAFVVIILIPNAYSFALQGNGRTDNLDFMNSLNILMSWYPAYSIVAFYQASLLHFRAEVMLNQENFYIKDPYDPKDYLAIILPVLFTWTIFAIWFMYGGTKLLTRPKVLREIPLEYADNHLKEKSVIEEEMRLRR